MVVGDFGAILEGTLSSGLRGVRSPTLEILRGVATADGRWVGVGSGGVRSPRVTARHWTRTASPTSADLRGVAWTGRRFVAVGDEGTVLSSDDGRHWRLDRARCRARCSASRVAPGGSWRVAVAAASRPRPALGGTRRGG